MWSDEYQQHMKKQTQKQHQERRKAKALQNEQPKMKPNDSEAQQESDLLKLEGSQSSHKASKDKIVLDQEILQIREKTEDSKGVDQQAQQEESKGDGKQPMLNLHRFFKQKAPSKEKKIGEPEEEQSYLLQNRAWCDTEAHRR